MTAGDAGRVILEMLEELPFYGEEREALQFALIVLHEKQLRGESPTRAGTEARETKERSGL